MSDSFPELPPLVILNPDLIDDPYTYENGYSSPALNLNAINSLQNENPMYENLSPDSTLQPSYYDPELVSNLIDQIISSPTQMDISNVDHEQVVSSDPQTFEIEPSALVPYKKSSWIDNYVLVKDTIHEIEETIYTVQNLQCNNKKGIFHWRIFVTLHPDEYAYKADNLPIRLVLNEEENEFHRSLPRKIIKNDFHGEWNPPFLSPGDKIVVTKFFVFNHPSTEDPKKSMVEVNYENNSSLIYAKATEFRIKKMRKLRVVAGIIQKAQSSKNVKQEMWIVGKDQPITYRIADSLSFLGEPKSLKTGDLIYILQVVLPQKIHFTPPKYVEHLRSPRERNEATCMTLTNCCIPLQIKIMDSETKNFVTNPSSRININPSKYHHFVNTYEEVLAAAALGSINYIKEKMKKCTITSSHDLLDSPNYTINRHNLYFKRTYRIVTHFYNHFEEATSHWREGSNFAVLQVSSQIQIAYGVVVCVETQPESRSILVDFETWPEYGKFKKEDKEMLDGLYDQFSKGELIISLVLDSSRTGFESRYKTFRSSLLLKTLTRTTSSYEIPIPEQRLEENIEHQNLEEETMDQASTSVCSAQVEKPPKQQRILQVLLGTTQDSMNTEADHPFDLEYKLQNNQEQIKAARRFIFNEEAGVTKMEAPAGTGKTEVIKVTANELVSRIINGSVKGPIMIICPTNELAIMEADDVTSLLHDNIGNKEFEALVILSQRISKDPKLKHKKWYRCITAERIKELQDTEQWEQLSKKAQKQLKHYQKMQLSKKNRAAGEKIAVTQIIKQRNPQLIFLTMGMAEILIKPLAHVKYLFLDEAGTVPESTLMSLICHLPDLEKFFLTGDHLQLPPYTANIIKELSQIGMKSMLDSLEETNNTEKITLITNFRSHPFIVHILKKVYDELVAGRSLANSIKLTSCKELNLPAKNIPVMFLHTSQHCRNVPGKTTRTNDAQTDIVRRLMEKFSEIKTLGDMGVTIVCIYEGQTLALKEVFKDEKKWPNVRVKTLDSWQGQSDDFIIIVTTRSGPLDRKYDLSSFSFTLDDRRAIVSLTRAKYGLALIGNFSILLNGTVYGKCISEACKFTPIVDAIFYLEKIMVNQFVSYVPTKDFPSEYQYFNPKTFVGSDDMLATDPSFSLNNKFKEVLNNLEFNRRKRLNFQSNLSNFHPLERRCDQFMDSVPTQQPIQQPTQYLPYNTQLQQPSTSSFFNQLSTALIPNKIRRIDQQQIDTSSSLQNPFPPQQYSSGWMFK